MEDGGEHVISEISPKRDGRVRESVACPHSLTPTLQKEKKKESLEETKEKLGWHRELGLKSSVGEGWGRNRL